MKTAIKAKWIAHRRRTRPWLPMAVTGELEFLEDVADVGLDGVCADPEAFADAAVGESFSQLHFPR